MSHSPNYMTPDGHAQMRAELKELLYVKRPDTVRRVTDAAAEGDRSENAEYIYGKRHLAKLDSRIRFLTKYLETAQVIDPVAQGAVAQGRILFGATVTIADEDGEEKIYRIVGAEETHGGNNLISWRSPIGQALLRKKAGDVFTVQTPGGARELEVIAVNYLPITGVTIVSRV